MTTPETPPRCHKCNRRLVTVQKYQLCSRCYQRWRRGYKTNDELSDKLIGDIVELVIQKLNENNAYKGKKK